MSSYSKKALHLAGEQAEKAANEYTELTQKVVLQAQAIEMLTAALDDVIESYDLCMKHLENKSVFKGVVNGFFVTMGNNKQALKEVREMLGEEKV